MRELPELLGTLRAFAIPMRTKFRGITLREGALIQGPGGWGEFSPFAEYGPAESARWLASAIESATTRWPASVLDSVPVNVIVPAVGPERAYEIVAVAGLPDGWLLRRSGVMEDDIERVAGGPRRARRGHQRAGGSVVDANGVIAEEAAAAAAASARALRPGSTPNSPGATWDGAHRLCRRVDIPIAADESIRKAEDPLKVRAAGAADIVMVKVQPLGGVRAALRVAEACGLPVVVSSAVDTFIGLAAGVALAAALPALLLRACGLATKSLLAGDVTAAPLAEAGGELPVRRPSVDEAALAQWETDPAPWRQRALAAAEYLAASPETLPRG